MLLESPYHIDKIASAVTADDLKCKKFFFDGVFKGDYSLAIVNRYLARALLAKGLDVTLYTSEGEWRSDLHLVAMPDIRKKLAGEMPKRGIFDVHLRNTWPASTTGMIGAINAYVCFAWEEMEFPQRLVAQFNANLDLVMVTSAFVERALRHSGVTTDIAVVGNGCDHVLQWQERQARPTPESPSRLLHISSCFPRKAPDVLVKAFAEAFSPKDNVELLIKTFPNPHNNVQDIVASAKRTNPNSAPIAVTMESLPYARLTALMQNSAAIVAPSRGEGFGLPLAEAMVLGIPVVTTASSGQADFCNRQTAWIVDADFSASSSHVSGKCSIWAEPSAISLQKQMRAVLIDSAEKRDRIAKAQKHLLSFFKWSDVANRVERALSLKLAAGNDILFQRQSIASIDLVTTWTQQCGIATYAEHLFSSEPFAGKTIKVLARELRSDTHEFQGSRTVEVERVWGYDKAGVDRLANRIARGNSDILWFQHHPGFFSGPDMMQLAGARSEGGYKASAVTLHNVQDALRGGMHSWIGKFDAVFVHTGLDGQKLSEAGYRKFAVIPHGIRPARTAEAASSANFTIGTFGFLYPHKNIPLLLKAFAKARKFSPRFRLKILTCARNDTASLLERAKAEAIIDLLGLKDAVEARFDFLSDKEIENELSACDLLVFPYGHSTESTTGAARIAVAADRPLLCSNEAVLSELHPFAHVLARLDCDTLAEAMMTLASQAALRELHDIERREFAAWHDFGRVATRYLAHFEFLQRDKIIGNNGQPARIDAILPHGEGLRPGARRFRQAMSSKSGGWNERPISSGDQKIGQPDTVGAE